MLSHTVTGESTPTHRSPLPRSLCLGYRALISHSLVVSQRGSCWICGSRSLIFTMVHPSHSCGSEPGTAPTTLHGGPHLWLWLQLWGSLPSSFPLLWPLAMLLNLPSVPFSNFSPFPHPLLLISVHFFFRFCLLLLFILLKKLFLVLHSTSCSRYFPK